MSKVQTPLESKRLIYRAFTLSDAPRVYELLQDKDIIDNTISIPYPYLKGMAEEWISSHPKELAANHYIYAVLLKESNSLIGALLIEVTEAFKHGYLGYWIGKPYWGTGYGTEMVARINQFGFEELGLHRIYGEHFDFNIASGRVMEKNGMKQEGILREHKLKNGIFVNSHIKGILAQEWKA